MRSFGAVALVFALVISTEFLAVHSARSRQRSGPIRSVPVGADVKRDINFDCPEEFGYYSHPTDCTLYYVCVFGGALLESCTGGLMYSHELQTCDWPRNVGCEVTSAIGGEVLERLSDTDPPPRSPPPRRTAPPPPPPRAQPNPVVTSRGQPKFVREEYEKQQQLYEEVDDLPPAEEIESDRQQRVYRGQPSTIGQVQKDRDGYISQNSGRTLNSNIIPASIDNGKVGSFSIGTQVDARRPAAVTPAPQSYSKISNDVNDSVYETKFHIDSKNGDEIDLNKTKKLRIKRELTEKILSDFHLTTVNRPEKNNSNAATVNEFDVTTKEITTKHNDNHTITVSDVYMTDNISKKSDSHNTYVTNTNLTVTNKISDRSDKKDDIEDNFDMAWTTNDDIDQSEDQNERGKRQIRFYLRNGQTNFGKGWSVPRPVFGDFQPHNIDVNREKIRNQIRYKGFNGNQFFDFNPGPHSLDSNFLSTVVPYNSYHTHDFQSQSPFKPDSHDPFYFRFLHNPINSANQIITKSPPISSLESIENHFSSLNSGFYNNFPRQSSNPKVNQFSLQENFNSDIAQIKNRLPVQDSSHLSSTIVTGKPIVRVTSPHAKNQIYPIQNNSQVKLQKNKDPNLNTIANQKKNHSNKEYDIKDEGNENEDVTLEESYEDSEEDDKHYKLNFPKPPYEFTHPSNKYAEIENPFANPNFNFEEFLDKLRNDHYEAIGVTTSRPKIIENILKIIGPPKDSTTASYTNSKLRSSTLHYKGMSTPRPFTVPSESISYTKSNQENNLISLAKPTVQSEQLRIQLLNHPSYNLQSHPQQFSENILSQPPFQNPSTSIYPAKPKIKPPNFSDDRQLPINYNFNRPINIAVTPILSDTKPKLNLESTQPITKKPNLVIASNTDPSFTFLTPKNQYVAKPEKIVSLQPYSLPRENPNQVPSIKSSDSYMSIIQTTSRPLTTLANEQLSALQQYWGNKGFPSHQSILSTTEKPKVVSELPRIESLFSKNLSPLQQMPVQNQNNYVSQTKYTSTSKYMTPVTQSPPKRKLIPKPSPEMNDYYYDDDESAQYYNEPKVKPKYMPISEVMPQRPPMAQNYREYDDSEESKENINVNQRRPPPRQPIKFNTEKPITVTKSYNDVLVSIKPSVKDSDNYNTEKILTPVMVEIGTTVPSISLSSNVSKYENIHHPVRNRTLHLKPTQYEKSPYTVKPPKYLNQTTLRSYTLRHRLAKATTEKDFAMQTEDVKQNRGKMRHQNLVAQIKNTTPRNSQKTLYNKFKHNEKPISLEPTENVTPVSYSASPSPKMLYNSSLSYNAEQYDPYYAVYDEDGELYKDTDYVQQYNTGSIRPAVQQTYRGTPPPPTPPRRPIETFVKPVSSDIEYDDALIQGQINNPSQYQTAIHHSTRGEGNELGYDIPTSETTPAYEATPLSTTPSTTSTSTTTTTQRSTYALLTEAMTTSRYTTRPIPTRGRGSAHYSTASATEAAPQQPVNRGTPPTRSRPTLKPSTAIVSKATENVDIYVHPPSRPSSVYPQPTPDKTAAKCRKDVCLLPDCFCGGRDVPGDLPMESIPQIVLLTFDDSVNDLNKGLYADLFEKGRVNPNGCPISATFYVSHEWTDYSQVQNLYAAGHEMASHTVSHSFGEQFSQKKWNREVAGQREILAAYGGVKLEDVRGMRAPFLSVGGNKMFKMLYDSNFTYDSSLPVYENKPPSWPYTLDYKLFHDCMIPPCPTKSYPGVWEVPMVMWQDLNGGRCSMGDACANPGDADGVYKMILKNFDRHYTSNRAPFGLFYHAAYFTQPHHKEGFIKFLDFINAMPDVWIVTNWQALQWVRDPTPISRINNFQPFQCNYQDRPKKCNNPKVCNLWHKSGVRYMRTCQPCPEIYPWTGKSGIRSSRVDHDTE